MGKKHNKKRFFIVKYVMKPDKKFDEFVELSKKTIGAGKMAEAKVVLDLVNEKVVKCDLPGTQGIEIPYENEGFQRSWGPRHSADSLYLSLG